MRGERVEEWRGSSQLRSFLARGEAVAEHQHNRLSTSQHLVCRQNVHINLQLYDQLLGWSHQAMSGASNTTSSCEPYAHDDTAVDHHLNHLLLLETACEDFQSSIDMMCFCAR